MLTRKQQKQREQKKMREQSELAKLAKQVGRLPDGSLPKDKKKKDDGTSLLVNYRANDTRHIPSAAPSITVTEQGIFLEEGHDWAARERIAQEEIEKKKKRIAPLFNKGGLQYITDDTDLTTVGRKI